MRKLILGIGAAALACSVGCNKSTSVGAQPQLTLKGNVPASQRTLDNARVVAIGSDGRVLWSYLGVAHDFSIALPAGTSYRILIANALASGQERVVGHLMNQTPSGPTQWIGTGVVATFNLGSLHVVGAGSPSSTVTVQDHGGGGGGGGENEAMDGGGSGGGANDSKGDGGHDCDTHEDETGGRLSAALRRRVATTTRTMPSSRPTTILAIPWVATAGTKTRTKTKTKTKTPRERSPARAQMAAQAAAAAAALPGAAAVRRRGAAAEVVVARAPRAP